MNKSTVILCLAIALFTLGSLIASANYLLWRLPGGLPFGNLLTAIGLLSAALSAFGASKPSTPLRWFALMAGVLAVAWLPISIALAGNLALNFSGTNGRYWIVFSLVTLAAALVSMTWATVRIALDKGSAAQPRISH